MKSFFDKLPLNTLVFLVLVASSISSAEAAERDKKYEDIEVFMCRTREDAKRSNDHLQSFVDVARGQRTKPLPFPEGIKCGDLEATFEVIDYADESLNGEGLDKEGNIAKVRYLIVNVSEPIILNGAFIMVSRSTIIEGIDPPEKRAGVTLPATLLPVPKVPGQLNGADQSSDSPQKTTKTTPRIVPAGSDSANPGKVEPSR